MITNMMCKHTFILTAIMLNLRNWIFYYIKIGEMAYHAQFSNSSNEDTNESIGLERIYRTAGKMKSLLNWVSIFTILVVDLSLIGIAARMIYIVKNPGDISTWASHEIFTILLFKWIAYFKYVSSCSLIFFAVLFLVFGTLSQYRLRKYFPEFYRENNKMIWIASGVLFASLMCSGLIELEVIVSGNEGEFRAYYYLHQ